jgi:hypothetical protein
MYLKGKDLEAVKVCRGFNFFRFRGEVLFCSLVIPPSSHFYSVEKTNDAVDALHSGSCLRAVVKY